MSSPSSLDHPAADVDTTATANVAVAAVELASLSKRYGGVSAVSDVSLSVQTGELIAVLGASGSGKTTLLRMIAGFEPLTEGRISLFGRDVSRLSPADREIGMVFQNYALMPHLTVRRNVEYGLKMRGWSRADRTERVTEMLERMRLQQLGDRFPRQLSGGQQQRVAIARALAYSPKVLLMDEPMGALDKALKQELLAEIRRVHREFSTTIFYVTHDPEEALALADRVALMAGSELIDCRPVQEMYLRPSTRLAAELFAGASLFPVDVHETGPTGTTVGLAGVARTLKGTASGVAATVAIQPSAIVADPAESFDGWVVPAVIDDVVFLGEYVRATVHTSGLPGSQVRIGVHVPLALATTWTPGDRLDLGIDPARCHLIDQATAQ